MEKPSKIIRPTSKEITRNAWDEERRREEIRERSEKSAEQAAKRVRKLGNLPVTSSN
jgi:hypothetical protein